MRAENGEVMFIRKELGLFALSVVAIASLTGCNATKKEVRKALDEVKAKHSECHVALGKLMLGSIYGYDWLYEAADRVLQNHDKFSAILNRNHISFEISYAPDIASSCSFSDATKFLNPGVVELMDILEDTLIITPENEQNFIVDKIQVLITGKNGDELYNLNANAKADRDSSGARVLTYYVNAGDYENGLAGDRILEQTMQLSFGEGVAK